MQVKTETKVGFFILVALAIFAYMTVYLGVFRVNLHNYKEYSMYFQDLSGLARKADVKIAGVKVGWVEDVNLVSDSQVRVKVMVPTRYMLYSDAYGEIRQEGLLGSKYLEIVPGSPAMGNLSPGATLAKQGKSAVSMEELLQKIQHIAENVSDVTDSLRGALGGPEQQHQMKAIVENIHQVTDKMLVFSDMLARNERNIDTTLKNIETFTHDLAPMSGEIRHVIQQLDQQIMPTFQKGVDKISQAIDRNLDRIALHFDATFENMKSISKKIDAGDGTLGKLINDDELYDDVKAVAKTFKTAASLLGELELIVDTHTESMGRPSDFYNHADTKGYLDFRLHTSEDKFYLVQMMGTQKGTISRKVTYNRYASQDAPLDDTELKQLPCSFWVEPFEVNKVRVERNTWKFGFQFGKIYNDIALRFGMFENAVGVGVDYEIPFKSDRFRWVTTFEMFDFRGQQRLDDLRPHLKWLNRMYFMRNLYLDFGADDFISKRNANAFCGLGVRFTDEDFKYFFTQIGSLGMMLR